MAECMLFMFYRREHHSEHVESWKLFEEQHDTQKRNIAGITAATPTGTAGGDEVTEPQKKKIKAIPVKKELYDAVETEGRALAAGLKKAFALKAMYQTTTALASAILARVEDTTSEWCCLSNAANVGQDD